MVSPGRFSSGRGCRLSPSRLVSARSSRFGKRTRKPNSVYAVIPLGEALPLALISDLPGGSGDSRAALPHRADAQPAPGSWPRFPSLFGLAPCGVYPAAGITAGAVRSYRTFSPFPGLAVQAYALRANRPCLSANVLEVCFLWHLPSTGLEARVPDVIRHTTLWSSDFPLPEGLV